MDFAKWQKENGQHLSASVTWLRLRLTQLAEQTQTGDSGAPGRAWLRRTASNGKPSSAELELREAAAARDNAAKMDPPPALHLLAEQLRLTPFERNVLLLCVAMELDTRVCELCARASGSAEQVYPTFALAMTLFDSPSWDALSSQRPLRFWRVIEVNQGPSQPLTAASLRADERIVNYVKGLNAMDGRLSLMLSAAGSFAGALPPSQQTKVEEIVEGWPSANLAEPPVALLLGVDVPAKLAVAQAVSARLSRTMYRLSLDALPSQLSEIDNLARLWQRESALMPLSLFIDAQTESGSPEHQIALDRFVARAVRSDSFVFVGSREPLARSSFATRTFDIARPTPEEQHAEWLTALRELPERSRAEAAAKLAGQFSLNTSEIRRVTAETPTQPVESLPERLWDRCRDRLRPRLDTLAQRVDPRATWNDLVVTEATEHLLHDIVAQVANRSTVYNMWQFAHRMNRGLGITALFTGESGTGKTMAAEVISNELRLTLYRIDLSQVVSKYIGETEKNLQRVFDLMEGGGSILFFDEADALFGKRSEVRDSHDRYANIEVNYLLQRMETYTGLAILATNMKGALDQAFVRRLRFIVPFAFPGPSERRSLWKKVFPEALPTEELDFDRLSRLNLTGASIHSIALNAAFLAARDRTPVTMPLILRAARTEFRKTDRPVSEAEFRV
jgi:hypothetical protein